MTLSHLGSARSYRYFGATWTSWRTGIVLWPLRKFLVFQILLTVQGNKGATGDSGFQGLQGPRVST